jgi:hypothetical protein
MNGIPTLHTGKAVTAVERTAGDGFHVEIELEPAAAG